MKQPRRNHSGAFKARVAMEAIRGIKTVAEIVAENSLHPTQVTKWKKELSKGAPELFERRVAHSHATVSDEFKDPFSTAAGYGQLAGSVV